MDRKLLHSSAENLNANGFAVSQYTVTAYLYCEIIDVQNFCQVTSQSMIQSLWLIFIVYCTELSQCRGSFVCSQIVARVVHTGSNDI